MAHASVTGTRLQVDRVLDLPTILLRWLSAFGMNLMWYFTPPFH